VAGSTHDGGGSHIPRSRPARLAKQPAECKVIDLRFQEALRLQEMDGPASPAGALAAPSVWYPCGFDSRAVSGRCIEIVAVDCEELRIRSVPADANGRSGAGMARSKSLRSSRRVRGSVGVNAQGSASGLCSEALILRAKRDLIGTRIPEASPLRDAGLDHSSKIPELRVRRSDRSESARYVRGIIEAGIGHQHAECRKISGFRRNNDQGNVQFTGEVGTVQRPAAP